MHVQCDPHDVCVECHPSWGYHQTFYFFQFFNRVYPSLLRVGSVTFGLALHRLLRIRILPKCLQHFVKDRVQGKDVLSIWQLLKVDTQPEGD